MMINQLRWILLPLWALALLSARPTPPAYRTYHNARFGFHIDYPADLRPQPEPTNGDGRRFVSADGYTTLSAYAGYNALDGGLAANRKISRQGWQELQARISLDQLTGGGTGYVLSGQVKDWISTRRPYSKVARSRPSSGNTQLHARRRWMLLSDTPCRPGSPVWPATERRGIVPCLGWARWPASPRGPAPPHRAELITTTPQRRSTSSAASTKPTMPITTPSNFLVFL